MYNSVVKMFEATAARLPDKIAVVDGPRQITFRALQEMALSAATLFLKTLEGRNGISPIMIFLPKSIEALACQLGAEYSGNPYVPTDTNAPARRLQTIVSGLGQAMIVTNQKYLTKLSGLEHDNAPIVLLEDRPEEADREAIDRAVGGVMDADPCYIMFTSGSTGVPKGVTIPHRAVLDFSSWLEDTFHFDETDIMGNESAFYFDNSVLSISTMLRTGATLNLIPEQLFRLPEMLMDYVEENRITVAFFVPTVMIMVANSGTLDGRTLPDLKFVLFAGEAMPNRQLNVWRNALPDKLYANLYGPTEATDICIYYIVDRAFTDAEPLPIGKPCGNMRILILDEQNQPCKVGQTGEICVMGSGIALGYWNNPEQTSKSFVRNMCSPMYDDRMYRTGDLGYWAEDGNIGFVGRKDFQIKRRGNRIELGEIEAAANSIPEVENACVVYDAKTENLILCIETEETLQLRQMNSKLRKMIPGYMLPTELVCFKQLPHTANGKINRLTLRELVVKD